MTPTLHLTLCTGGRRVVVAMIAALAFLASPTAFAATTIFDSLGFEQPKFSTTFSNPQTAYTGQLEGQAIFPEPLPVGTWKQTKPIGVYDSKATVVGNVPVAPASGSQSVQVTRAANTDARWAVTDTGWPSERYVCIDWDMYVVQSMVPLGSFGPYFAVEAYDDDAASIGLLASFGVDASNGEVLFQAEGTGFLTAAGPTVAFSSWNHFTILLDYATHEFDLYLNSVLVPAIDASSMSMIELDGFVDHTLANPLDEFTDAPIATLAAGGDPNSLAATGTAYFDNYKVIQSATNPCVVPEPATCVLGVLAAAGFGAVARKSRRN